MYEKIKIIRTKLVNNELSIGAWQQIPHASISEILGKSGYDCVAVDMEHGSMDYTTAQQMVISAHSENCDAIIRTPRNDESNILKSLDIGPGSQVITTPFTWIITINAILATGATPVFADIKDDLNIKDKFKSEVY